MTEELFSDFIHVPGDVSLIETPQSLLAHPGGCVCGMCGVEFFIDAPARLYDGSGLAIMPAATGSLHTVGRGNYLVSHLESGRGLTIAHSLEAAEEMLARLQGVADWRKPEAAITDEAVFERVRSVQGADLALYRGGFDPFARRR